MGPNYIALAIPVFVASLAVEIAVARARRRQHHRFADVFANLGCGIFQQVTLVFFHVALLAVYSFLWARDRLLDLSPAEPAAWIVAFVGVDFLYYWWHRLSHEVNFLWAAHIVHHQSEDYNLAVALRQALTTSFTVVPFYLPLALLGVPPLVYATTVAASTLYQFWIHTELVGKLGPVEWLLNTPSHHRVHHAINAPYLDKNYGATLMIWDRLFGTLRVETEPPIYGITKPLRSFNPLWAQIHYWIELWHASRATPRWRDKLRVWVASPAWRAPGLPPPERRDPATRHDVAPSPRHQWYVGANLLAAVIGTFLLLHFEPRLGWPARGAIALAIVLTLLAGGALLEGRRWARVVEVARLAACAALPLAVR